jgi:hypothetical protein
MGYNGACRREELTKMCVDDIQYITYRSGYCINSPIGINTREKVPKTIAAFLELPNPELYTGHCFRRSSATHIANSGGDLLSIKRLGGWKSSGSSLSNYERTLRLFCFNLQVLLKAMSKLRCKIKLK